VLYGYGGSFQKWLPLRFDNSLLPQRARGRCRVVIVIGEMTDLDFHIER